jgi:acetyl-CoA synthetase
MARTILGNHPRYLDCYFSQFPGYYVTGDEAVQDEDGYYWIKGRVDDVINCAGHRISTSEVENALVAHELYADCSSSSKDKSIGPGQSKQVH